MAVAELSEERAFRTIRKEIILTSSDRSIDQAIEKLAEVLLHFSLSLFDGLDLLDPFEVTRDFLLQKRLKDQVRQRGLG